MCGVSVHLFHMYQGDLYMLVPGAQNRFSCTKHVKCEDAMLLFCIPLCINTIFLLEDGVGLCQVHSIACFVSFDTCGAFRKNIFCMFHNVIVS